MRYGWKNKHESIQVRIKFDSNKKIVQIEYMFYRQSNLLLDVYPSEKGLLELRQICRHKVDKGVFGR
jgi:hypothetical protein